MPREIRKIVFSADELHQAMVDFASRGGAPLPRGELESLTFDPAAEPALVITQRQRQSALPNRLAFRLAEVVAGLILHCRDKGVPLPRNCRRALAPHPEGIAFDIAID